MRSWAWQLASMGHGMRAGPGGHLEQAESGGGRWGWDGHSVVAGSAPSHGAGELSQSGAKSELNFRSQL